MRTTIDIADEQYGRLKVEAALNRTSVKALISQGVDLVLRERSASRSERTMPPRWPTLQGGNPEALSRITNDAIFGFDDEL